MDNQIVNQVVEHLNAFSNNLQRQVLDYVQALRLSTGNGVPGSDLLQFAGTISSDDLHKISQAIEDGCEQVESDGW